jgi:hypothetical protein
MKALIVVLLLTFPALVSGQDMSAFSEENMQQMMVRAQKMQTCLEKIDQEKLAELEQRSDQLDKDLDVLCKSGKRDEAQEKAVSFARRMAKDPLVLQMSKCAENMKGMMPPGVDMQAEMPFGDLEKELKESGHNVCDE